MAAGDLDGVLACYEPGACGVLESGEVVTGAALRQALSSFCTLNPAFEGVRIQVVARDDIALSCMEWALKATNPDGTSTELSGRSSDVLRRQHDGSWLLAIDSPWGTAAMLP